MKTKNGVLKWWSIGVMEPGLVHYSITPILHYSILRRC